MGAIQLVNVGLALAHPKYVSFQNSAIYKNIVSPLSHSHLHCLCLCAFFDAAQLDLHRKVLMKYQTRFLQVVAVKEFYRELCEKRVIHRTVEAKITDSRSVKEARGHLFDHMRDYGTLDTLKVFCDVITSEEYDGIKAMQDLGKQIKDMLEQEG